MVQVVSKWVFMLIALLSRDAVCVLECLVLCLCALVFTYLWRYIKYDALFCTGSRRSMHFSWLLILQHESVQISVVLAVPGGYHVCGLLTGFRCGWVHLLHRDP